MKDISSDQNVIQLTTSKYLEEGEYHIIFEVVGSTQTIVKDKDEFSYQNWLEVPLSKENTYYYTLDGEYSGDQIIKITISGEKNRKDFIIPFEVR